MTIKLVQAPLPKMPPDDAGRLLVFAMEHTDGYTWEDAAAEFSWSRRRVGQATHTLRVILATEPENLVCEQETPLRPWVYRLTDEKGHTRAWASNRVLDLETRLETMLGVAQSTVKATDGRTDPGKRARVMERGIRHILENLADLREQQAM